jgi:radical SAM superfamily enzyme YgiQ (UPF0313 family)
LGYDEGMIAARGSDFDVILISGEPYADHPLSAIGIIARVLDAKGYRVGVIGRPDWKTDRDFIRLGKPRLFFGITSGSIDSLLVNYTPLKRDRSRDPNVPRVSGIPDRAVLVYSNKVKHLFPGVPVVIGGVEASLRRFAHYDYWNNKVRRSLLLDSRADILVYGPGELQAIEIARRLDRGEDLAGIEGTCVVRPEAPAGFALLPSYEEVSRDAAAFNRAQRLFSNNRPLAQPHAGRFVLQYPAPAYTTADLDWIYGLPYRREIPDDFPEFGMARFSVVTHRGCIGDCSFCALSLHQGDRIVSRSEESILAEIRRITRHPEFRGIIDDLGGPTANMYGMDCPDARKPDSQADHFSGDIRISAPNGRFCGLEGTDQRDASGENYPLEHDEESGKIRGCLSGSCLACRKLDRSHSRLISLLRKARAVPGVKKVFVRSGIRYDLAMESPEYIEELCGHHTSGRLKIAPEHVSPGVLRLMNKTTRPLEEFRGLFRRLSRGRPQELKYYFMVAHPGTSEKEARELAQYLIRLEKEGGNPIEGVQIFTPTPMTRSTAMYWTGMDPLTGEAVHVSRTFQEKKAQKRMCPRPAGGRDED